MQEVTFEWPKGFEPENVPVYVRNERKINADPELVWDWLVRAPLWPTWYPNCHSVRIDTGDQRILCADSQFSWTVLGLSMQSKIHQYEIGKRIGWRAESDLLHACHVWDIHPTSGGCYVVTDETQTGFLPNFFFFILRPIMQRAHDLWLQRLDDQTRKGAPPP